MPIKTVLLKTAEHTIEVNPLLVAAIRPYELKAETVTVVNVFGHEYRVLGKCSEISKLLGFEAVEIPGLVELSVVPSSAKPDPVDFSKTLKPDEAVKPTTGSRPGNLSDL